MFDPEIPSRYIEAHYEPGDRLAVVLINRKTGTIKHEFGSAEFLASPRYQAHLRAANAHGADVYLTVNTLNPDAKRRTKTDVAVIRHLYLDIDEGGPTALSRLLLDRDMPKPHSVLESSPGKYQVLWQVENFSPQHAETVVRGLARQFGADAAVWDTARVLRLPGFRNHKYETPHYVVEIPNSPPPYRLRPLDFPAFPESTPQAAEPARCCSQSSGRFASLAERTGLGFREPGARPRRRPRRHQAKDRHIPARQAQPGLLRRAHRRQGADSA